MMKTVVPGLADAGLAGRTVRLEGRMATLEFPSSANALFASSLQPSDRPDPAQVRVAITATFGALGDIGCAARVAQEFGDHPETAVPRMRWARAVTSRREPGPESRPVPRSRLGGVHDGHLPPSDIPSGALGMCS
jgi:hypothetical protein